jgi:hypothetical protein
MLLYITAAHSATQQHVGQRIIAMQACNLAQEDQTFMVPDQEHSSFYAVLIAQLFLIGNKNSKQKGLEPPTCSLFASPLYPLSYC